MNKINVSFDKRFELVYGLLYSEHILSGYGANSIFNESFEPYCSDFVDLYKKYVSNELREYIRSDGFSNYNRVAEICLSMDEDYIIKDDKDIRYIENISSSYNKDKINSLIKKFVDNSKYEEFVDSHKLNLENIKNEYINFMSKYIKLDGNDIAEFYGEKRFDIQIILYNFCNYSFGITQNNKIYNVRNVHNFSDDRTKLLLGRDNIPNYYHECSHPYMNPLGEKYFKGINLYDFYNEAKCNGLSDGYNNSFTLVNEYMVRTVQVYFCNKYMEKDYFERHLNYQKECGFIYIEELLELFKLKDNYNSFEEFYKNEIVDFFVEKNNTLKSS